jgi:hypothetical protein
MLYSFSLQLYRFEMSNRINQQPAHKHKAKLTKGQEFPIKNRAASIPAGGSVPFRQGPAGLPERGPPTSPDMFIESPWCFSQFTMVIRSRCQDVFQRSSRQVPAHVPKVFLQNALAFHKPSGR